VPETHLSIINLPPNPTHPVLLNHPPDPTHPPTHPPDPTHPPTHPPHHLFSTPPPPHTHTSFPPPTQPPTWLTMMRLQGMPSSRSVASSRLLSLMPNMVGMVAMMNSVWPLSRNSFFTMRTRSCRGGWVGWVGGCGCGCVGVCGCGGGSDTPGGLPEGDLCGLHASHGLHGAAVGILRTALLWTACQRMHVPPSTYDTDVAIDCQLSRDSFGTGSTSHHRECITRLQLQQ
jgi:hypothetical protein